MQLATLAVIHPAGSRAGCSRCSVCALRNGDAKQSRLARTHRVSRSLARAGCGRPSRPRLRSLCAYTVVKPPECSTIMTFPYPLNSSAKMTLPSRGSVIAVPGVVAMSMPSCGADEVPLNALMSLPRNGHENRAFVALPRAKLRHLRVRLLPPVLAATAACRWSGPRCAGLHERLAAPCCGPETGSRGATVLTILRRRCRARAARRDQVYRELPVGVRNEEAIPGLDAVRRRELVYPRQLPVVASRMPGRS